MKKPKKKPSKVRVRLAPPPEHQWGHAPTRGRTVHVRLSDSEYENLARHAKDGGMVLSMYVRACIHHVMGEGTKL